MRNVGETMLMLELYLGRIQTKSRCKRGYENIYISMEGGQVV